MAASADLKPMPATRIEPVIAPVMIIGKPSQIIDTEKVLRRAFSGTGSCSYSSPSSWASAVTACVVCVMVAFFGKVVACH